MVLSSVSSQQRVVRMAKPGSAASQPGSDGSELAQRLALLARLQPEVLRKLMKITDADLVLNLTRRPEMIDRLVQQPRALGAITVELARLQPDFGLSLRGIRRFLMGGVLRISA